MKTHRFELGLAAAFLALFAAFWLWQNPGLSGAGMSKPEIERYMSAAAKLPFPAEEQGELMTRLRSWLENDDGKPVYMLNLMRFYPQLRAIPGAPDFQGTPQQSNAHYEDAAMRLLLKSGAYPVYAGNGAGPNLIGFGAQIDHWSRVLVVRYPSRRAFAELLADPAYAPIEPYKMMAVKLGLAPQAREIVLPDMTWVAGTLLLVLYLAIGWQRAARRPNSN